MWSRSGRARFAEALAGAALAGALLAGCGAELPHGGVDAPGKPEPFAIDRRIEAQELIPADLDLVLRIDLSRMRASLGKEPTAELLARAAGEGADPFMHDALGRADVVWLAMRLVDIDDGDRLVILEGNYEGKRPDEAGWNTAPSTNKRVAIFDRRTPAPRGGVARIVSLGDHAVAFVSPVEVASIARVLREGPDNGRGDPRAEGLVSADLRARKLPRRLAKAYPHINKVLAGVDRVRGTATLVDEGGNLEAEVITRDDASARLAHDFLVAVRDNVEDPRYADAIRAVKIEHVGSTVRIRWTVPAKLVLALIAGG